MVDQENEIATNETIENETRMHISGFLPDAIAQALKSYYRFSQQRAPEEAKEFSAHHSACKVAIAHIELLIKLARWADLPNEKSEDQNHQVILAAMVQQAQDELVRYKETQKHKGKLDKQSKDD